MIKKEKKFLELPKKYKMKTFPISIDFFIPGFLKNYDPGYNKVLALENRKCEGWYNEFINKCIDACGKTHLPIYRMSDGEFLFILGEQPQDIRLPLLKKLRNKISNLKLKMDLKGGIGAWTNEYKDNKVSRKLRYHSGQYSSNEWRKSRLEQPSLIKKIAENGVLALHLNYIPEPFGERYWPALDNWLKKHKILINKNNYFPFYFVYAMLTGERRGELFNDRRILVVHGEKGEKKQKIIDSLKREGVSKVEWISISLKRSMFDVIDVKPYIGKVDLALVGAGVGKSYILGQMEPLSVPCIDAGFIFEVWSDPESKWERSFCASDKDWENIGSDPNSAEI